MLLQIKQALIANELNKPPEKFKAKSTKELAKDLINKFNVLNVAKYLSSGIFQSDLLFIPSKLNILVALPEMIRGYLMECQKKILYDN